MNVTVDIFSDVICPWCFIGKRRYEKAVANLANVDVRIRWHPYQLNPQMPQEGISRREYRIRKFGSWERSMQLDANIVAVGKEEGIEFDFERMERTPNTCDAHRLIDLAHQQGMQDAVVEALFRAYFTEGQDLSNRETLIDIVIAAGLDREAAQAMLSSDAGKDLIQQSQLEARRVGVEGVPFFVINGQVALSGAQPPEIIQAAIQEAIGADSDSR